MTDMATRPGDEAELAVTIRDAAASGTPLFIRGGGTRTVAAPIPDNARHVSLAGLSGIRIYDPGALTLVAAAGTPMHEIDALLASENQSLPFEPMDHRAILGTNGAPTIGGAVATNASGPRRVAAGACRDHLLGVRFVDGSGQIIRSGGRVMKNVTGLDLGKLLCGAGGTLGVLTEVALKVLPAPRLGTTLSYPDRDRSAAVTLFCDALRTPFEISGAAWRDGTAHLRIEGSDTQVAYRRERLLARFGAAEVIEGAAHADLWRGFRDVTHFAGPGDLWRIVARPTDAPAICAALRDRLGAATSLDWGGGLIWAAGPDLAPSAVQNCLTGAKGHARRLRPPAGAAPVAETTAPRVAAVSRALKDRFDPAHILNPRLAAM
ncbi:MAG: FAD-binding protein [Rhodobacteraceae bacterium]|nr:FAD-binding protein [Paracoccaceae bacterium]